jgi:hypothetical protein
VASVLAVLELSSFADNGELGRPVFKAFCNARGKGEFVRELLRDSAFDPFP